MSESSIVAICVALISSLSAIICKIIDKTKRKYPEKNTKTKIPNILFILSFIVAISSVGTLIYLQFLSKHTPDIVINYPTDNEYVEKTIVVKGRYKNISKNEKIWIFIYPLKINHYYPQNTSAELEANGKWSSLIYVGQDNDIGQRFNIVAILANKNSTIEIEDYLRTAKDKQDWYGMEEIPEGALKFQTITVVRK